MNQKFLYNIYNNPDAFIKLIGKDKYNRLRAYADADQYGSSVKGLSDLDSYKLYQNLNTNYDGFVNAVGKNKAAQLYNSAKADFNNDVKTTTKFKNGYSADILNASAWLKDKFVYENTYEDKLRKKIGVVPSAFDSAAKDIVKQAKDITKSQQPAYSRSWDDILTGNRPPTETELREAIGVINKATGTSPYLKQETAGLSPQEQTHSPGMDRPESRFGIPYPGAPGNGDPEHGLIRLPGTGKPGMSVTLPNREPKDKGRFSVQEPMRIQLTSGQPGLNDNGGDEKTQDDKRDPLTEDHVYITQDEYISYLDALEDEYNTYYSETDKYGNPKPKATPEDFNKKKVKLEENWQWSKEQGNATNTKSILIPVPGVELTNTKTGEKVTSEDIDFDTAMNFLYTPEELRDKKVKEFIKNAQAIGMIDPSIDVESLSPGELQTVADEGISNFKKAQYAYQHMSMPYPGAPSLGPYEKPRAIPTNSAELESAITDAQEQVDTLEQQMKDLDNQIQTSITISEIGPDGQSYSVPTGKPLTEEQKDMVSQFDTLRKEYGNAKAWLGALEKARFDKKDEENKFLMEDGVIQAEDYQKLVDESYQVLTTYPHTSEDGYLMNYVADPNFINTSSYSFDREYQKFKYLTDQERDVFRYLWMKMRDPDTKPEIQEKAKEVFKSYKSFFITTHMLDKREGIAKEAERNKVYDSMGDFGKVIAAGSSFLSNFGAAPMGLMGAAYETGENILTGENRPMDPYAPALAPTRITNEIRDYTLKDMEGFERVAAELGYSIGDFITTLPFPGLSLYIITSRTANQAVYDAAQRGAPPEQALMEGVAYAATEYITEKLPLNKLFGIVDAAKAAKQAGKALTKGQILKLLYGQGLIDGGGELISAVANLVEDQAIMGDKSHLNLRIKELIESGMSREDAESQAYWEAAYDIAIQAGGGFFTGMLYSGGAIVTGDIKGGAGTDIDSDERMGDNGGQEIDGVKRDYTGKPYSGKRNPDTDFTDRKGNSTFTIHFNDHAGELGYNTEAEYRSGANNFFEKPPTPTTQTFITNEGTYFRYDTATNEFGIINKYGGISTYFKPDDGITYWLDQIERYAPK